MKNQRHYYSSSTSSPLFRCGSLSVSGMSAAYLFPGVLPSYHLFDHTMNRIFVALGTTHEEMRFKTRRRDIVYRRYVVAYLIRKRFLKPLEWVGEYINHDHTSVIHGMKAVELAREGFNPELLGLLVIAEGVI